MAGRNRWRVGGPNDYIIVGAGSAGAALAYRLGADPGLRILVLEAGGWDRDPWIKLPIAWEKVFREGLHDWHYRCDPQTHLDGRMCVAIAGIMSDGRPRA